MGSAAPAWVGGRIEVGLMVDVARLRGAGPGELLLVVLVFLTVFLAALRTGVFFCFRVDLAAAFLLVAMTTSRKYLHFENSIVAE
jgi:hypothetical protein